MEKYSPERNNSRRNRLVSFLAAGVLVTALGFGVGYMDRGSESSSEQSRERLVHSDIVATVFWVGEEASSDNDNIHNSSSAWVEDWVGKYGGVDDPSDRCDYRPCAFTPKENPFYVALPYNDLDENGSQKPSAAGIPGYDPHAPKDESQLKNGWVKITYGDKTAYGQWEDVGPFGEEDFAYVFGGAKPQEPRAGIDLSPAVAGYIGMDGRGVVSWQFVGESEVPQGPWLSTVTRD